MEWELPRNGTCGAKERTGIFTKVDPDHGRVNFVAIAFFDRADDLGFAKVTTTVKKFDPASMRRGNQPAGNISSPGRLRLSFNDVTVVPAAARASIINRRDAIYAAAAS
ncbi:hypothetical protein quinque_015882 [Culex quinquefasciatus]